MSIPFLSSIPDIQKKPPRELEITVPNRTKVKKIRELVKLLPDLRYIGQPGLIFAGTPMSNNKALDEYGMKPGSSSFIVITSHAAQNELR